MVDRRTTSEQTNLHSKSNHNPYATNRNGHSAIEKPCQHKIHLCILDAPTTRENNKKSGCPDDLR